mgnify:FL=1
MNSGSKFPSRWAGMQDWAERIRRGEPLPPVLGAALQAATVIPRAGMWLRLRSRRARVDARVISFGNITAGGVGKTPDVIERAGFELAAGRKVAVITRGYRAQKTSEPLAVSSHDLADDLADRIGDEAALILRRVPDVIVVKAAKRVAGARLAIAQYGCDTLILDDGFQHVALERDENILLIDAVNPFGNGYLIPRGILREPLRAIRRATAIILTRCDQCPDPDAIARRVRALHPDVPIRRTIHAPDRFYRVSDGTSLSLETLCREPVHAVCAIGSPESFFKTLESLGLDLASRKTFPDHADIPADALPRNGWVLITEKDAVRLRATRDNIVALAVSLRDCQCGQPSSTT